MTRLYGLYRTAFLDNCWKRIIWMVKCKITQRAVGIIKGDGIEPILNITSVGANPLFNLKTGC